jgi:hypothetical protein
LPFHDLISSSGIFSNSESSIGIEKNLEDSILILALVYNQLISSKAIRLVLTLIWMGAGAIASAFFINKLENVILLDRNSNLIISMCINS